MPPTLRNGALHATAGLPAVWEPMRYHGGQYALWRDQRRFLAVAAGRGSGKTALAKRKLVAALPIITPWSDPRYFYGAPTYRQARRVAWKDLGSLTPPAWSARIGNADMTIETVFGSTLAVVGLDKAARIEGVQWDGCVLDESSDLKPGVFDLSVFPALTHRRGWCWRIGVPKRNGVGAVEFRDFFERAGRGEIPDAAAYTWPSSDILPRDVLAHAREALDPKDYREQFEASWETAGGGVFYAFDRTKNVRPCSYCPDKLLIVGSDFNVDPMCWIVGHAHDEKRLEWVDEIWLRDANTQATLDVLWSRYASHRGGWVFIGDAASRQRRTSAALTDYQIILRDARFEAAGRRIAYPSVNPNVADRFAACNAMLENAAGERRMHVDPRCRRLIKDLESRHYKAGSREPEDTGDVGHITDAMGYVVHKLFPIKLDGRATPRVAITQGR